MRFLLSLLVFLFATSSCGKRNDYQKSLDLSDDWEFYPREIPATTEPEFENESGQIVDLIRDGESHMPVNNEAVAEMRKILDQESGWYRKSFILDEDNKGKTIYLYFNEIFPDPGLWLNGEKVEAFRKEGNSWLYKITDEVSFEEENIISIRADSSIIPSYPHDYDSFLFREAELIIANPVHLKPGGIHVKASRTDDQKTKLEISVELINDRPEPVSIKVISHIYHPDEGKLVAVNSSGLKLNDSLSVTQLTKLDNVGIKKNGIPVIYECVTDVLTSGNTILDTYVHRFVIESAGLKSE